MHTTRLLARRTAQRVWTQQSRRAPTSGGRTIANHPSCIRLFSAAAPAPQPAPRQQQQPSQEELIKEALKELLMDRNSSSEGHPIKAIADDELERRFQQLEDLLGEARLCLTDLREGAGETFEDDSIDAKRAIDTAFSAYVELLEDLRRATDDQLQSMSERRLQTATTCKKLRKELEEIIQNV